MSRASPAAKALATTLGTATAAAGSYLLYSTATTITLQRAGGISGLVGVGCGAFGFHGLKRVLGPGHPNMQQMMQFWNIGANYQLLHSAALLGTAALPAASGVPAGLGFLGGVVLFSGSIYMYVLSGRKAFQYMTPFGGLSFMAGWAAIAVYHLSSSLKRQQAFEVQVER
ncbi:hypothetical protein WJX72_008728 [[Myrmecia] bisecta]|uniref:Uncharacterized protein n=1 Tax=[Myrmecia] bisecta TaxID=41462 RepID=A0AAW1QFW4_9CHLO